MGYPLMYQQHKWQTFELTMRCQQGRFLLRPGDEANRRLAGVLGRTQQLYGEHVRLHLVAGTSNHLHFIISARSADWKARFKAHFKTNVSKELGDLYDWRNSHWSRRTRDIPILDNEALRDRLAYLAAHCVKDGLAETTGAWPGVQWLRALTDGVPVRGIWYDRTALHHMRLAWSKAGEKGPRPGLMDVAEIYTVKFTPPAMWEDLSEPELRAEWCQLAEDAIERYPPPRPGRAMTPQQVLAQDPHGKPRRSKHSPAPAVHTSDPSLRKAWKAAYALFCETWRAAALMLAEGLAVELPKEGCRPPWLPIPGSAALCT